MIHPSFFLPPIRVEFGLREKLENCLSERGVSQKEAAKFAILFADTKRHPIEVYFHAASAEKTAAIACALFACAKKR